ncbi:cell division protein ZipA [Nitrococcus mobilis]|uniref:Cell division protein ZipA n=1 Tax=Nitrococcus mobilis Nb-231 TaxID=314278 RepID=A4BM29_9GAMM|nr:cell division protein ZipA [Nitrococcus mobilis]EAR23367.1 cell division protein ZipA [Nitrococcus mobilis Nb-231]
MEELRWLLLILGLLVIVLVYGYGRVQEWRDEGPPWRRRAKLEPFADEALSSEDIEGTLSELDSLISEHQEELGEPYRSEPVAAADDHNGVGASRADDESSAPPQPSSHRSERHEGRLASLLGGRGKNLQPEPAHEPENKARNSGEEKLVVINLVALPEDGRFAGPELVHAMEAAGMHYGAHRIFHRLLDTRLLNTHSSPCVLFSAANILEPGWFDLEQIANFDTPGVVFFMRLPGPYDGLVTFEQMLTTARTVAERVGGQLLDRRHCDLTQQAIEHIREDLIEYRRRAHLAARQAR